MTVLPIVERELRVAARRPWTYRGRWVAVLVLWAAFVWLSWLGVAGEDGGRVFRVLLFLAGLCGCALALMASADTLSRERREGTLGLLFLTDLSTADVVLGKFAAGWVGSVYVLLGTVPILWLTTQLGGVTAVELGLGAAALVNVCFFCLALGLLVSVHSQDARKALYGSWLAFFGWIFAPMVVGGVLLNTFSGRPGAGDSAMSTLAAMIMMLNPLMSMLLVTSGELSSAASGWFSPLQLATGSLVACQLLGWLFLLVTARRLRHLWHPVARESRGERVQRAWHRWVYGEGAARVRLRVRLLALHPIVWLMQRERGKAWYAWIYLGSVFLVWATGNGLFDGVLLDAKSAVPGLLIIGGFLKLWVLSESAVRLCEDRRVGAVELLLTTPLTVGEIVRGHWLALRRQFLGPVFGMLALQSYVLVETFDLKVAVAGALVLVGDLAAVSWAGMWFAASARDINRAVSSGFGLVLVLPWVLFVLAMQFWRETGLQALFRGTAGLIVWWACVGLLVDGAVIVACRAALMRSGARRLSEGGHGR